MSYLDIYRNVSLDTRVVPQRLLDLEDKSRANLFPWRGQFSPQLVEVLLAHFAGDKAFVFDPFVGVGTTLFEAARRGSPSLGTEINPAAVTMAQTTIFMRCSQSERIDIFRTAENLLKDNVLQESAALCEETTGPGGYVRPLLELTLSLNGDPYLYNIFANTLIRALSIAEAPSQAVIVASLESHKRLVFGLPESDVPSLVHHGDARRIPLDHPVIDLVITSPPYVNVFNYHQNNRAAMELLGWKLLRVAHSEFGSNRKNRGNRFITVVQYCIDMFDVLLQMHHVLRPGGRVIYVVGRESRVRSVPIPNGAIVAALAHEAGFKIVLRQERKFVNKFGKIIFEDILHFQPRRSRRIVLGGVEYAVARAFLLEALPSTNDPDIRSDICSAIDGLLAVKGSPIFRLEDSRDPCRQHLT